MADFTTGSNTLNNPVDWFPLGYTFNSTTDVTTLDLTGAMAALGFTGVTDADLHTTTGDVRAVYLALAEFLYLSYNAQSASEATTSNRLKMTRSRTVDSTNNIRYSTYTIHIQEDGTASGGTSFQAPNFASSGVRAE